jgi:hypothetical protein
MLPEIKNSFIDVFTVGDYKLCCYSNCLVFGLPTYEEGELKFQSNNYLKISEHHFLRYFQFFSKTLQMVEPLKPEEKNKETGLINIDEDLNSKCVTYIFSENAEKDQINVQITSKYETKVSFQFDLEELYRFFVGFRNLCFKIYCYPIHIEVCVFNILTNEPMTYIEQLCQNTQSEFRLPGVSYKLYNQMDLNYVSNIFVRHQRLLSKIKCSMDYYPNEIEDS